MIQRILGRDNHKGFRQLVGYPFKGHPPFLHRLKQGTLGFRQGAIDFVNQEKMIENRPLNKMKTVLLTIKNGNPGNITRQQITSALNAPEVEPEGGGQSQSQAGFTQTRDILDQYMTSRQQTDHGGTQSLNLPLQVST